MRHEDAAMAADGYRTEGERGVDEGADEDAECDWFPMSRTKLRIHAGTELLDAKVRARIVIENTTPITVITAAAMAMSTWRPASALSVRIQNGSVRCR